MTKGMSFRLEDRVVFGSWMGVWFGVHEVKQVFVL